MTKGITGFRAVTLAAAAIAAGCAAVELRSELRRIDIAADMFLVLPGAHELTRSFDATQVISATYEEERRTFEAHLEARPGRITIVGLSAVGVVLFSISYDGIELKATGVSEVQVINAEYVLADVLLSHWDIDWLRPRLEGGSIESSGNVRKVLRDGVTVIEVQLESGTPWSGKTRLDHHERGYSLRIDNLAFIQR